MKTSKASRKSQPIVDPQAGRLLRALRQRREWSSTEAAVRCDMTENYFMKLELAFRPVSNSALVKIARGFGLTVETLAAELRITQAARNGGAA